MIAIVFVLIFLAAMAGACVNSAAGVLTCVVLLAGALVAYVVLRVRGWA